MLCPSLPSPSLSFFCNKLGNLLKLRCKGKYFIACRKLFMLIFIKLNSYHIFCSILGIISSTFQSKIPILMSTEEVKMIKSIQNKHVIKKNFKNSDKMGWEKLRKQVVKNFQQKKRSINSNSESIKPDRKWKASKN